MIWNFIIFPTVGAIIGAFTNEVAIRMLFRPYKQKHFLGLKVPFTPGVIPAQRGAIAKNIADTFEKNLLSGKEIHQIMTGDEVRGTIESKVAEMFESFGPMAAMFSSFQPKVVAKILEGVEEMVTAATAPGGSLHIGEKIEAKINEMDLKVLEEMILSVAKKQLQHITFFGGILGFVIGLVQATISLYTL